MNPSLRERLIRAEQHFLLAVVSNDEDSLKVFFQGWSQLARDIENTQAAGRLDDNTAHLLFKVSQAIENVATCMLESGSILQESLTCSIGDFIQDIPSGDPPSASRHSQAIAPYYLLFSEVSSSINPTILGQQKLLDSYAYCWLMQNIHDPYPKSMQIQILGDVSGTSTAQVELWFQEARDSIGWNKLTRDFFAGSANATVAAARRVYLEHDKNISFEIVFAFSVVKASAETLFLEYPPLQGKNVDARSVGANQTMVMRQEHMGSSPGEYIIDPDSILVLPQVDLPAPLDPLSDFSDSDESEEEDTTPPPPIAGCKRLLAEDESTSQAADLGRPQKRLRTWPVNWAPSSDPECPPVLPSTLEVSSEQIAHMSAAAVSTFPSLHPLSPASPESSPNPPHSVSRKRRYTKDSIESTVGSIPTDVSVHGNRKRRLSQCVSLAPSKRQRCPSISFTQHAGMNSTPPSDQCRDRPTDFDAFPPTIQAPVPGIPVNFDVFDWNSIWDPSAGTASSISQPAVVHVPSSDLISQLLEPPDLGHDAKIMSSSPSDLGSLEDLSSSLQFPMPAGPPPDLSTSFAPSPHSADSSLLLQDIDWSTITELIDLFPPDSTQSSSSLTSSSDPSTHPEILHLSLPPPQSCDTSEQPLFEPDSLAPPSTFLPFGSGTFTGGVDHMWSLLCGES